MVTNLAVWHSRVYEATFMWVLKSIYQIFKQLKPLLGIKCLADKLHIRVTKTNFAWVKHLQIFHLSKCVEKSLVIY